MPSEIAATFLDPELLRSNRDAIAGRSKVHASTPEWMSFLRRLDSAGMLLLAAEDEIPRHGNYAWKCFDPENFPYFRLAGVA